MPRRLIEARLNRGLSVPQAAKLIGVDRRTLEKAEAGERVHEGVAKKIADFWGLTVVEIWPLEPVERVA